MALDKDLASIQEARELVNNAFSAWQTWSRASQEQVDRVCAAMAEAAFGAAERLGRMAHEETGYGVPAHKKLKNEFAARNVWESIRNIKTVGVIGRDDARKIIEIAWPMGVVAALTPSTNPTSTVIFKILIAVKARDAIVIAPHPSAVRCCYEAAVLMAQAAEANGAPKGLISCMQHVSLPGTNELMTHKNTAVILATGGTPMVRAAHSTGKPAYGVGPATCRCTWIGLQILKRQPGTSSLQKRLIAQPFAHRTGGGGGCSHLIPPGAIDAGAGCLLYL